MPNLVDVSSEWIGGTVAPGFEAVAAEFERNFSERGDLGAAFAASIAGEPIVDLWGGTARRGDPPVRWGRGTLQLIFSGTKALVSICLLMLIDRGELALEDPVSRHWPEFGAEGKGAVTVAELVSHRARLPGVRTPLTDADLADGRRIANLLAAQPQESDHRARAIYHSLTFGWLCGELVRRVDGRPVGRFFAEEVAAPLDLEAWIGLPEEQEPRVSRIEYAPTWDPSPGSLEGDPLFEAVENPRMFVEGLTPWNTRAFHAAEIPGVSAIATPRSIARLYAALVADSGPRLISSATMALGRTELSRFREPLSGEPLAYGAGFCLQTEWRHLGPERNAFGHTGAGGSVHGAWPDRGVGFSYAMNQLRPASAEGDPRSRPLLEALHAALV